MYLFIVYGVSLLVFPNRNETTNQQSYQLFIAGGVHLANVTQSVLLRFFVTIRLLEVMT